MKFLLCFNFLFFGFFLHADQKDISAWKDAQEAYSQGKIDEAENMLSTIEEKGYGPWCMIGALYEAQKNYTNALIAYEKAGRYVSCFWFLDYVTRVYRCRERLGFHDSYYQFLFHKMVTHIPSILFQLIFLILFLLLIVVNLPRILKISLAILAVLFFSLMVANAVEKRYPIGIVKYASSLYVGPSKRYDTIKDIVAGDYVSLQCYADGGWILVTQGVDGWLERDTVEIVETKS